MIVGRFLEVVIVFVFPKTTNVLKSGKKKFTTTTKQARYNIIYKWMILLKTKMI